MCSPSILPDIHLHPELCICFIPRFVQPCPAMSTHIHSQIFLRSLRESSPETSSLMEGHHPDDTRSPVCCSPHPSPLCLNHHHPKNNAVIHFLLPECTYFALCRVLSRPRGQHQSGAYRGIPKPCGLLWPRSEQHCAETVGSDRDIDWGVTDASSKSRGSLRPGLS